MQISLGMASTRCQQLPGKRGNHRHNAEEEECRQETCSQWCDRADTCGASRNLCVRAMASAQINRQALEYRSKRRTAGRRTYARFGKAGEGRFGLQALPRVRRIGTEFEGEVNLANR